MAEDIEVSIFEDAADCASPATIQLQCSEHDSSLKIIHKEPAIEKEPTNPPNSLIHSREDDGERKYFHIVTKKCRTRGRRRKYPRPLSDVVKKAVRPVKRNGRRSKPICTVQSQPTNPQPHVPPLMVNERPKRKLSTRFAAYLEVIKGKRDFYIDNEDDEQPTCDTQPQNNRILEPADDESVEHHALADGEVSLHSSNLEDVSDKTCVIHVKEFEGKSEELLQKDAVIQPLINEDIVHDMFTMSKQDSSDVSNCQPHDKGNDNVFSYVVRNIDSKNGSSFADFLIIDSAKREIGEIFEIPEKLDGIEGPDTKVNQDDILDTSHHFVLSQSNCTVFDSDKTDLDIPVASIVPNTIDNSVNIVTADDKSLDSRKFRCKVCYQSYPTLLEARDHAKRDHQMKENFQCPTCDRQFPTERGRNKHHFLAHLKNNPVQCSICLSPFKSFRPLERHLRDIHDKNPTKFCNLCEEEFILSSSLEHHIEISHPTSRSLKNSLKPQTPKQKELLQCPICKKMILGAKSLRSHHLSIHLGESYKCSQCSYKTISISGYRKHLTKVHKASAVYLYICTECGAGYHEAEDLEEHCKAVHKRPLAHLCSYCGEKFAAIEMLRFHRSKHRAHSCKICHLGFTKEESFDEHMIKVHLTDIPIASTDAGDDVFDSESATPIVKVLEINNDGMLDVKKPYSLNDNISVIDDNATDAAINNYNMVFHLHKTEQGDLQRLSETETLKGIKMKDLPKKINCPICHKLLTTNFLKVHMRSHEGNYPYKCHKCSKAYTQTTLLRKHMRNRHYEEYLKMNNKRPKRSRIECDRCEMSFNDIYLLEEHLWIHMDTKPFECVMCGIKFGMEVSYKEHFRRHYFKDGKSCPICARVFKSVGFYQEHIDRCVNNWECDMCGVKCETADHYRLHKKVEHDTNLVTYQCEYCEKAFYSKYRYADHILVHSSDKNYVCHLCKKTFKRQNPLSKHIMKCHTVTNHVCEVCNSTFPYLSELEIHKKAHKEKHSCNYCEVTFLCHQTLENHVDVYHENPDGRTHSCAFCGASFRKQIDMKNHLNVHVPDAPYPCQVNNCHKLFRKEPVLRSHMSRSHSYLDYYCYLCDRKCLLDSDLQVHVATHQTKSSVICCPKCNFSCSTETLLEKHLLQHSHNNLFECCICGYKSLHKKGMYRHVELKHDIKQPLNHILVNKWRCSACSKVFMSYKSLFKHLEMHIVHNIHAEGLSLRTRLSNITEETYESMSLVEFNTIWDDIAPLLMVQVIAETEHSETGVPVKLEGSTWQCPSCYYLANSEDSMKSHFLSSSSCQEFMLFTNYGLHHDKIDKEVDPKPSTSEQSNTQYLLVDENKNTDTPILLMDNPFQFMQNDDNSFSILNNVHDNLSVPLISVPSIEQPGETVNEELQPVEVTEDTLQSDQDSQLADSTNVLIHIDNGQIICKKMPLAFYLPL